MADFKSFWLKGRTESKQIQNHIGYISVSASAANQRCLPSNTSDGERGSTSRTAAHHLHPHRDAVSKISHLCDSDYWVYTDCVLLLLTKDFLRGYHHPKEKLLANLHVFYMRSCSQRAYLSDSSQCIKITCTGAHSGCSYWRKTRLAH